MEGTSSEKAQMPKVCQSSRQSQEERLSEHRDSGEVRMEQYTRKKATGIPAHPPQRQCWQSAQTAPWEQMQVHLLIPNSMAAREVRQVC